MHASAAILRHAQAPFAIEPLDLPEPGGNEILVRVAGVGMGPIDLVVRHIPAEWAPLPAVLGPEGSGIVRGGGPRSAERRGGRVGVGRGWSRLAAAHDKKQT